MNRHSRYKFDVAPDGAGFYVSLFYPDNTGVHLYMTVEEFREFLRAGFAASADARDKRDDKRRQALGYANLVPAPINNYYIASGGGGGETIESLERRRRLMLYYHYPLNKPRPRRIVNRVTPPRRPR